jgi:hypothetical protein
MKGYKLETWTKTKWKGTKREQKTTINRLVQRDKKGRFISVITDIREKRIGENIYYVGYRNNKIKTRKLKQKIIIEKGAVIKEPQHIDMYRTSYVLNNVPISKSGYYGFRIAAFSNNKELLYSIKDKLKRRLIRFIEKCVKYNQDEFWFYMYFGYEAPSLNNISIRDNGKYELSMENKFGIVIKEESGEISKL